MINRILVVCTGNICRSPMGEALLRARLPGRSVLSAGTMALIGEPADPLACQVMLAAGLDIGAHRGQQATPALLGASDLILVMDRGHRAWISRQHPQLHGRVHKLLKWRENGDVDDPYGQPQAAFEKAYAEIAAGVEDWLKAL